MGFGVSERPFPEDGCALVFGGSGGLGQAIAGLMAEQGSNVAVTYRKTREAAEDIVGKMQALGRKASAHQINLRDSADVRRVTEEVIAEYGRIHTVVSSGGVAFDVGPLADFDEDMFRDVIETDTFGFFNIAKATIPHMREKGGSVVSLITCANGKTLMNDALSATPKAGVQQMTWQIASEEGVHGIRANAVGPGVIDAGLVPVMREAAGPLLDALVEMTPLQREGVAAEIAEAVVFLASSRAAYISGQSLHVDGGWTA